MWAQVSVSVWYVDKQNTSRQTRQLTDLDNILKVLSDAKIGIDNSSIKDFFVLESLIQNTIPNALVQF